MFLSNSGKICKKNENLHLQNHLWTEQMFFAFTHIKYHNPKACVCVSVHWMEFAACLRVCYVYHVMCEFWVCHSLKPSFLVFWYIFTKFWAVFIMSVLFLKWVSYICVAKFYVEGLNDMIYEMKRTGWNDVSIIYLFVLLYYYVTS
jgi:hypothetical protein